MVLLGPKAVILIREEEKLAQSSADALTTGILAVPRMMLLEASGLESSILYIYIEFRS